MACLALMSVASLDCDPVPDAPNGSVCTSVFSIQGDTLAPPKKHSQAVRRMLAHLGLPTSKQTAFVAFASAAALSNCLTAVQFWRASALPSATRWARVYAVSSSVGAVAWALAAPFAADYTMRISVGSFVAAVHVVADFWSRQCRNHLPTALPAHLSARFRKFGVVMLTQVLMGVMRPDLNYSGEAMLFAAAVLALLTLFKIVYFDLDQGSRSDRFAGYPEWTEWLYLLANMVLTGCITALGATTAAILMDLASTSVSIRPSLQQRVKWLLTSSLGIGLLSSCVIQLSLQGAGSRVRVMRKRYRILVRALLSLGLTVAPAYLPASLTPMHILLLQVLGLLFQLIVDIYGMRRRILPRTAAELEALAEEDGTAHLLGYSLLPEGQHLSDGPTQRAPSVHSRPALSDLLGAGDVVLGKHLGRASGAAAAEPDCPQRGRPAHAPNAVESTHSRVRAGPLSLNISQPDLSAPPSSPANSSIVEYLLGQRQEEASTTAFGGGQS